MNKEQALAYCYRYESQYKADCNNSGENGDRLFNALIHILETDVIEPDEIVDYGMDYEEPTQ